MKPFILCLIMVLLCQLGYSQYLLGLNQDEVKTHARTLSNNDNIKFKEFEDEKYHTLSWDDSEIQCEIIVFFNLSTLRSVLTSWIPHDKSVFKAFAKSFDEDYSRISNTKWRARYDSKTIDISTLWAKNISKYVINFKEIKPEDDN